MASSEDSKETSKTPRVKRSIKERVKAMAEVQSRKVVRAQERFARAQNELNDALDVLESEKNALAELLAAAGQPASSQPSSEQQ
jgi:hypothetical protein